MPPPRCRWSCSRCPAVCNPLQGSHGCWAAASAWQRVLGCWLAHHQEARRLSQQLAQAMPQQTGKLSRLQQRVLPGVGRGGLRAWAAQRRRLQQHGAAPREQRDRLSRRYKPEEMGQAGSDRTRVECSVHSYDTSSQHCVPMHFTHRLRQVDAAVVAASAACSKPAVRRRSASRAAGRMEGERGSLTFGT